MKIDIKKSIDMSGISKSELSKMLGISYPTMLSIYNGEATSIRLDTLEKLCLILTCTPNEILKFEVDKNYLETEETNVFGFPYINQLKNRTENFDKLLDHATIDLKIEKDSDGNVIAIPIYKLKKEYEENDDSHE